MKEIGERLKSMTQEELEGLLLAVQEELARRKPADLVAVRLETEGWFDPRKHGHAYVAFIKRNEAGKIEREFVNRTNIVYDRKGRAYKAEWIFEAPIGAVLEARLYEGSWKNECRGYYRVTKDGLVDITQEEALGL